MPVLGGNFEISFEGRFIKDVKKISGQPEFCLGPGLFDIQVNGYAGRTCEIAGENKLDAVRYITDIFWQNGIAMWIPTVCTASRETLTRAFRYLGRALDEDSELASAVPGFHMEGPYISPDDGPRGAHSLEHVRKPDWEEFQQIQEASGGRIKYVTVAPELDGAESFIRKCSDSGVIVGMGHTNMGREDMRRAVDAGAKLSTHLGNGAHDMIQRHNNYIWYQLDSRQTYASFIIDGHHLPSECAASMISAKGKGLSIIVSDCVRLGGMKPGKYSSGSVELLPTGRLVLVGTTNLAGSSSNLRECVEVAPGTARLTHPEAWELASVRPAQLLRIPERLGIEEGKEATFTVYEYDEISGSINVRQTWLAGEKVFDVDTTKKVEIPDTPVDDSMF